MKIERANLMAVGSGLAETRGHGGEEWCRVDDGRGAPWSWAVGRGHLAKSRARHIGFAGAPAGIARWMCSPTHTSPASLSSLPKVGRGFLWFHGLRNDHRLTCDLTPFPSHSKTSFATCLDRSLVMCSRSLPRAIRDTYSGLSIAMMNVLRC